MLYYKDMKLIHSTCDFICSSLYGMSIHVYII